MRTFDDFWNDICTYKLETKYKHAELKRGFKYANGCGAKGGIDVPDSIWLINISSACNIHDIEWELSKDYNDLVDANRRFSNNLKKITDYESMNNVMRWLRRYRVSTYVSAVDLVGIENYAIERGFINDNNK